MSTFDPSALAGARWFAGKGAAIGSAEVVDTLDLGRAALVLVDVDGERYAVPVVDGREARAGDGAYLALLERAGVRPEAGAFEISLGADQSHVSVLIGSAFLKSYRRLPGGRSVEAEIGRYLTREARYPHVPAFLGEAVWHDTTVAIVHEYVHDTGDLYEVVADALAWQLAKGEIAMLAAGVAEPLGERLAQLHAALAGLVAPRPATCDETVAWRDGALVALARARAALEGEDAATVDALAPGIETELASLEELAPPLVQRVHGDLHLGQVLAEQDGPIFIDFEGDPLLAPEQRAAPMPPARDLATLRRSIDHVARSAGRRAGERYGTADDRAAEAWIAEALERLDAAYRAAGGTIDPALVRALEIAKECYELLYAATYLPSWSWAPIESLRALVGGPAYPADA